MSNKIIYLVTNYSGKIPQKLHETVTLDIERLSEILENSFFEARVISLDDLANELTSSKIDVESVLFFFCSSQIEQYKNAVFDVAFEVYRRGGILVPSIDSYLAHENKYFQEMYKSRVGVATPCAKLLSTSNSDITSTLPAVIKPYSGFGSQGVQLAKSKSELKSGIHNNMSNYVLEKFNIREIAKRTIKYFVKFPNEYPKKVGRVVIQDFIPNLKHDWKVLVFGDRAFALKRFTRENDFRASGSGNFDYSSLASEGLIEFAFKARESLGVPFVSLDVAESDEGFSIIEYQSVHFGLATAINAQRFYSLDRGNIVVADCQGVDIEKLYASSIIDFISGEL
ncbi:TPA: RimK family alpha-L-glutamate ligase [Vibrio parahaemolyticus]